MFSSKKVKRTTVIGMALFMGSVVHTDQSFGAGRLAELAGEIATKLESVERQLTAQDSSFIHRSLEYVLSVLDRYEGGGGASYVCLSNGESGSWEKFSIYDSNANKTIGGQTTKAQCEEAMRSSRNGLVCVSNGETNNWEKFVPYDSRTSNQVGGFTTFNSCNRLVASSNMNFLCVSNGETNSWEKFGIYNRSRKSMIGGYTNLDNCLSSIPQN